MAHKLDKLSISIHVYTRQFQLSCFKGHSTIQTWLIKVSNLFRLFYFFLYSLFYKSFTLSPMITLVCLNSCLRKTKNRILIFIGSSITRIPMPLILVLSDERLSQVGPMTCLNAHVLYSWNGGPKPMMFTFGSQDMSSG